MTPPTTFKVLLVADTRAAAREPGTVNLRRYRLAKLRPDSRSNDPASRFEHLKRVFD